MIEAEFDAQIGAERYEHSPNRVKTEGKKIYRCGYRTKRFDTACGTLTLKNPHPQKSGVIHPFLKGYQRYEEALKQIIADAYANSILLH